MTTPKAQMSHSNSLSHVPCTAVLYRVYTTVTTLHDACVLKMCNQEAWIFTHFSNVETVKLFINTEQRKHPSSIFWPALQMYVQYKSSYSYMHIVCVITCHAVYQNGSEWHSLTVYTQSAYRTKSSTYMYVHTCECRNNHSSSILQWLHIRLSTAH